jgi:aldehyde dehydrogenase (NAD+)
MTDDTDVTNKVEAARSFFESGRTLDFSFREEQLLRLRRWILNNGQEIEKALREDLNKSAEESYMTETGMILSGLTYTLAHLKKWMRDRRVKTPLSLFPGKSYISPHPYGTVLVIAPWNYPFLLSLDPVAAAIAAGNTVVLKPSEFAPATAGLLERLAKEVFEPGLVQVAQGAQGTAEALLGERFDFIFFTGSAAVGASVMQKAAQFLTPVVLELGGKSPCIVTRSADIRLAARRIAFGKLLNAGQTCVAPDFVYADTQIKERLTDALIAEFDKMLPAGAASPDYVRIVNERHFARLQQLIAGESVRYGGTRDGLKIAPTILDNVTFESPVMRQEIFGPVLPILAYNDEQEMLARLKAMPHPLALYLFANDKSIERRIFRELNFGGGCVNDTIMHIASPHLPFGGVGTSGMGAYHGEAGFRAFSHERSVLKKGAFPDFAFRYLPYTRTGIALLKKFLR